MLSQRKSTYEDQLLIKSLSLGLKDIDPSLTSRHIQTEMLKLGIAPRPEQEILYEITLLENLKQRIVAPDYIPEEAPPTTLEGYQELMGKKEEMAKKERVLLEQ
jgi:hypothetical protein